MPQPPAGSVHSSQSGKRRWYRQCGFRIAEWPEIRSQPCKRSAIRNPRSAIRDPQSAIRNPQSAIRNSPTASLPLAAARPGSASPPAASSGPYSPALNHPHSASAPIPPAPARHKTRPAADPNTFSALLRQVIPLLLVLVRELPRRVRIIIRRRIAREFHPVQHPLRPIHIPRQHLRVHDLECTTPGSP